MVVVLSILGLATAIVAPATLRGIESWRRRGEIELVMDQLRGLPADARERGRDIIISGSTLAADPPVLRVGPEWTATTEAPWRVRHNGLCEGGLIRLSKDGRTTTIQALPPFCDPAIQVR